MAFNANKDIYGFIGFYIKVDSKEIYYLFAKFISYVTQFWSFVGKYKFIHVIYKVIYNYML